MRGFKSPLVIVIATAIVLSGCGAGEGRAPHPPSPSGTAAGGEKSIEDFGSEAEGAARTALLSRFHAYLRALGARDYPAACRFISVHLQHSLEQFAGGPTRHLVCGRLLPGLLTQSASLARQEYAGKVTKARIRGDRAFVVFHAPGAKLYMLTMSRSGEGWKTDLLVPAVLVPDLQ